MTYYTTTPPSPSSIAADLINAGSIVSGFGGMHDVIVHDEEYQAASAAIDKALKQLDSLFSSYVSTLKSISTNGTIEGQAARALETYADQAADVRKAISVIAGCHKRTGKAFLADVDETDQELF